MKPQVVATENDDDLFQLLQNSNAPERNLSSVAGTLEQKLELVKEDDDEEKSPDEDEDDRSHANSSKGSWSISLASLSFIPQGNKAQECSVPLSVGGKQTIRKSMSTCSLSSTLSNSGHQPKSILKKSSTSSLPALVQDRSSSLRSSHKRSSLKIGSDDATESSSNSVVGFQNVEIREYDRVLGDNPSCRSGAPISLDWSYHEKSHISVEDYEDERSKRPNYVRRSGKLPIHKMKRDEILKDWAYTDDELTAAKEELKKIRRSRSLNNFTSQFWRVEYACESLKRKVSRKMSKSPSSNELDVSQ